MSGRQRESHHLLHLTGASTSTSHQFLSDHTGPQFGASHLHAFSLTDRAAAGTARRTFAAENGACMRRLLHHPSATESWPRGSSRPRAAADATDLLKTTQEGLVPRQTFSSTRPSAAPRRRPLAYIPRIDKCICNRLDSYSHIL